jgi:putative FmdB family regulatory protein
MPTYEYQCQACGNKFEKFQSISSGPIRKCPKCGKNKVRRLISSGAGLIFKGSGFYITDYRSDSYKEKAKSESGEKPDTAKTDAAKTDSSKPEATKTEAPKKESSPAKTPNNPPKSTRKK